MQAEVDDPAQVAGFGQFPARTQDAAFGCVMHGMDIQLAAAAAFLDDTDLLDQIPGGFGSSASDRQPTAAVTLVSSQDGRAFQTGGLGHHQRVAAWPPLAWMILPPSVNPRAVVVTTKRVTASLISVCPPIMLMPSGSAVQLAWSITSGDFLGSR